jgi:hypothetical protein
MKPLSIALSGEGRRSSGRDGGGDLTNAQKKLIQNCHNAHTLYDEYILILKMCILGRITAQVKSWQDFIPVNKPVEMVCACDPSYMGGIGKQTAVWANPGKNVRPYLKNKYSSVIHVVECLRSKQETQCHQKKVLIF